MGLWSDQSTRVRNFIRIRVLACVFAVLGVLVTPVLLFAHARLVRSVPPAGGWVNAPPSILKLWFSEAPELRFTTIALHDSAGTAISLGSAEAIPNEPMGVSAFVTAPMGVGRYTVEWRTAAADGHATTGKFSFIVTRAPTPTVTPGAEAAAGQAPSAIATTTVVEPPQSGSQKAARWLEFVAILTLIGAVVFRLFVLPQAEWGNKLVDESALRARSLAQMALALFIIAAIMRLVIQSNLIPNATNERLAAILATVSHTRWGRGWLVGGVGAVVALAGLLVARSVHAGWIVAALGVLGICLGEALTGHAGAVARHTSIAVAADLAHFLGAGGWMGGLAAVLRCGLPVLQGVDDDRARRNGSQLVRAYHKAALECITLIVISAAIALWLRLDAFDELWTTDYGRYVLIKFGVVLVALGFGWHHWRNVVIPEWDLDTASRFQRSAASELIVGAVIAAVTVGLVATAIPMR